MKKLTPTPKLMAEIQKYLEDPNTQVRIYFNNETGEWLYSICVVGTEFWLDSFETREQALDYVAMHRLKLVS